MNAPLSSSSCPFPELLPYCDRDGYWSVPHSTGTHWLATDGKMLAWRADPQAPPRSTSTPVLDVVDRIIHAHAMVPVFYHLPEAMPGYDAAAAGTCTECKGAGSVVPDMDCEDCEGIGECPHCGHACDECDGTGRVPTGAPAIPCSHCGGSGKLPPSAVRIAGRLLAWKFARRLIDGKAVLAIDQGCRCPFLARMNGLDIAILDMSPDEEKPTPEYPELVLGGAA